MSKVLIVDDAADTHLILREAFGQEIRVVSAYTLGEATQSFKKDRFDLILLDVRLPDGNGFNYFARMKQDVATADLPVIFITGKSDISDKSIGFSLGAEDYIVKPFHPIEVKLRCMVRLQKRQTSVTKDLVLGDIRIEPSSHRIFLQKDGKEHQINVTPTQFKIFYYLVMNVDRVFTRDQMINGVWGSGTAIVDRAIDTHIAAIRKQIAGSKVEIKSVHGVGYRLVLSASSYATAA